MPMNLICSGLRLTRDVVVAVFGVVLDLVEQELQAPCLDRVAHFLARADAGRLVVQPVDQIKQPIDAFEPRRLWVGALE